MFIEFLNIAETRSAWLFCLTEDKIKMPVTSRVDSNITGFPDVYKTTFRNLRPSSSFLCHFSLFKI